MFASSATAIASASRRERDRLAVEVPVRDDLALRDEDERIVRGRVELDRDRAVDVAEQVAARAVHLRGAAERVRVLHLVAPAVRLDDRRALEQRPDVRGRVALARQRPGGVDRGVEARARALERLEGLRARDVRRTRQAPGADEPERGHRGHELRAVDQCEALLRSEPDRLPGRRRRAPRHPAAASRRPSPRPPRRAAARGARAGRDRRSRRPSRATGRAAGRRGSSSRAAARTVSTRAPEYPFASAFARSSIAARTTSGGIRLAHAARVAAQQAELELLGRLVRDRLRDEPAEAGVDAVGVLAAVCVEDGARGGDPIERRCPSAPPRDRRTATSQTSVDREVVAGEQDGVGHGRESRPRPQPVPALSAARSRPRAAAARARARRRARRARARVRPRRAPPLPAASRRARRRRRPRRARRLGSDPCDDLVRAGGPPVLDVHAHLDAPLRGSASPSARTPGKPPPASRTAAATARATSTSLVASSTLNATSGGRAPTSTAPARRIQPRRPEVGPKLARVDRRCSSSGPPRRKNAGRLPSPDRAVEEHREPELRRPRARPTSAPLASRAPCPRGPPERAARRRPRPPAGGRRRAARGRSALAARPMPASRTRRDRRRLPTSVKTRPVVILVRVHVEQPRPLRERSASEAITAASRPSETLGTASSGSTARTLGAV